jgi:hypothetical protein
MNTQETNDKQAEPIKRTLRATDLRHMPGIAVQTNLKAGARHDDKGKKKLSEKIL